ncbi:MAG: hypothetical protein NTV60_00085 [Candidatus Kaiserbacteria bacterium]|nr:hypothetical protein [Candidatus Kaiserbacteria bacterium]
MRNSGHTLSLAALLAVLLLAGGLVYLYQEISKLSNSVSLLQTSVAQLANSARITASSTAANIAEIARRNQVVQKSETQSLQDISKLVLLPNKYQRVPVSWCVVTGTL